MLPKTGEDLQQFEFLQMPSQTYRLNIERETIRGGTDGMEAMKQAIYKALNTERYDNLIYSWNYGVELKDLFGKPKDFVVSEIPRRIREALTCDDRIEEVTEFSFDTGKRGVIAVSFRVVTVEGAFDWETEVGY